MYPNDVDIVRLDGRTLILVGTAHISAESVALVHRVIEQERPDCVCIELDERRHRALVEKNRWEGLDLRQVIRDRQLSTLLINVVLSSYQKRLGGKLGVMPGTELLEAAQTARTLNIPVELCDRDIRITLRRAWSSLNFWEKAKLISSGLVGLVEENVQDTLDEDALRRLRDRDVLSELMDEIGRVMPSLRRVLIDERDAFLAQRIRETPGDKIVAVIGAGHVAGMHAMLVHGALLTPEQKQEITRIPEMSYGWKLLGWGLPLLLIACVAFIAYTKGAGAASHSVRYWVLANGVPAAAGTLLALGHPLTVIAAFLSAPITSLLPLIGVGHVTAFVQAYVHPPRVHEFSSVTEDIAITRQWWRSRLLRVLLVFILSSIGGVIGAWFGGAKLLSSLF